VKSILFVVLVFLLAAAQTSYVVANELDKYQAEADQYYAEGNYKKAFKGYFKLAKISDHYSQYWVSNMYANGEGKKVDLEYAYAWSALAAESGEQRHVRNSEELLARNDDKDGALKKAEKLSSKYGKRVLEKKARSTARRSTRSGTCTGSRLAC